MSKPRRVLVIRGSEWARGEQSQGRLLQADGKMCCLGIHAKACEVPLLPGFHRMPAVLAKDLSRSDAPLNLEYFDAWTLVNKHGERQNSVLATQASVINDVHGDDDDARIAALRPIFAEVGVDIDWRPDE